MSTQRWKLTLAYDGRPYQGWQSQASGRTVQDYLNSALRIVSKFDRLHLTASGRTDTGVHAVAQVAHFDAPQSISLDSQSWPRALNAHLPPSIRILDCSPAEADFHARFSAKRKTYRYEIDTTPTLLPLRYGLAWHVPHELDLQALQRAIGSFEGQHDFQSFAANRGKGNEPQSTIRTIFSATLNCNGQTIAAEFTGDGFLYRMVRLLIGSAIQVALHRESQAWLDQKLRCPDGQNSPYCAPPDGLYLVSVDYLSP